MLTPEEELEVKTLANEIAIINKKMRDIEEQVKKLSSDKDKLQTDYAILYRRKDELSKTLNRRLGQDAPTY